MKATVGMVECIGLQVAINSLQPCQSMNINTMPGSEFGTVQFLCKDGCYGMSMCCTHCFMLCDVTPCLVHPAILLTSVLGI